MENFQVSDPEDKNHEIERLTRGEMRQKWGKEWKRGRWKEGKEGGRGERRTHKFNSNFSKTRQMWPLLDSKSPIKCTK